MTATMTAGLIVAAGRPRAGTSHAPLRPVGSLHALERIVATFQRAGLDPIVVVTGHDAETIEALGNGSDLVFVRNARYAQSDMFASIKLGLKWLRNQCDAVVVTPATVPVVAPETVKRLVAQEALVAVPTIDGRGGHPLCLNMAIVPTLLADSGDGGLRSALTRAGVSITHVPTDDLGIKASDDAAIARLIERHDWALLRPKITLSLARRTTFFTPTSHRLLTHIAVTGSVAEACQALHLSYSKGWRLLKMMEEELGTTLVRRRQGGAAGGASSLTDDGERLVAWYERLLESAREAVDAVFDQSVEEAMTRWAHPAETSPTHSSS